MPKPLGIRREDKNIWERSVPVTPEQVERLVRDHGAEWPWPRWGSPASRLLQKSAEAYSRTSSQGTGRSPQATSPARVAEPPAAGVTHPPVVPLVFRRNSDESGFTAGGLYGAGNLAAGPSRARRTNWSISLAS